MAEKPETSPLLRDRRYDRAYYRNGPGDEQTVTLQSGVLENSNKPERRRERTISSLAPIPPSCYNINTFTIFLVCFQLLNLLTLTYTDSVINYITKRFKIPHTLAAFIPSSYEFGSMLIMIPVAYVGDRWNRPKVIAVGVIVMIIGLGFCILPHFILPAPAAHNSTVTYLCQPQIVANAKKTITLQHHSTCTKKHSTIYNPSLLLMIGHVLVGLGSAPIAPLGLSFIDDHVLQSKAPIYLGIYVGTSLLGPVLGFLLGSVTSKVYVTTSKFGNEIKSGNPDWIGAWWLGYVIIICLMLFLLFPFYFYPRYLPVSEEKEEEIMAIRKESLRRHEADAQKSTEDTIPCTEDNSSSSTPSKSTIFGKLVSAIKGCSLHMLCLTLYYLFKTFFYTDLLCAIQRTLVTPFVFSAILAYIAMANLLGGMSTFGPTYVQRMFNIQRTTADLLIGGVCIPMGVMATILSGYVIKKYNFDLRKTLLLIIVFSGAACIFFATLFLFGCKDLTVVGINKPFHQANGSLCSSQCGCPKDQFKVVCGSNKLNYISPCSAGCTASHLAPKSSNLLLKQKTIYTNCSCIPGKSNTAVSGTCTTTQCVGVLAGFLVCGSISVACYCFCQAPVYVMLLRVLETQDKALGIGLLAFASRLLGYIPGPIWFGILVDRSCKYHENKCGSKALCRLYNKYGLRLSFIGLSLACGMTYMLVFVATFAWMECHKNIYKTAVIYHGKSEDLLLGKTEANET
ncbi:solute carrier organic anion transporter family member 2A1-like isoform X2 [Ciona intestinalis]